MAVANERDVGLVESLLRFSTKSGVCIRNDCGPGHVSSHALLIMALYICAVLQRHSIALTCCRGRLGCRYSLITRCDVKPY